MSSGITSPRELLLAQEIKVICCCFAKRDLPIVVPLEIGKVQDEILQCTRIGVLPGTFDPPTLAHRGMGEWAFRKGGFDGILVLLDLRHADKGFMEAHLIDRCIMARLAFGGNQRIFLGLSSHGRFSDKTQALKHLFGTERSWAFLIGADTLARILNPVFYGDPQRELEALFAEAEFVVFRRPGWDDVAQGAFANLRISWAELPSALRSVSSTGVREKRKSGAQWTKWVNPKVARFIERFGLYQPGSYASRKSWLESLVGLP